MRAARFSAAAASVPGGDLLASSSYDELGAGKRDSFVQILANVPDIRAKIEPAPTVGLMNALVHLCHCQHAIRGFFEVRGHRWVVYCVRLKLEHARHDSEAVLDPVRNVLG